MAGTPASRETRAWRVVGAIAERRVIKPVVACWPGASNASRAALVLAAAGIPLFDSVERASRAIAHLFAQGRATREADRTPAQTPLAPARTTSTTVDLNSTTVLPNGRSAASRSVARTGCSRACIKAATTSPKFTGLWKRSSSVASTPRSASSRHRPNSPPPCSSRRRAVVMRLPPDQRTQLNGRLNQLKKALTLLVTRLEMRAGANQLSIVLAGPYSRRSCTSTRRLGCSASSPKLIAAENRGAAIAHVTIATKTTRRCSLPPAKGDLTHGVHQHDVQS
jgi:hypothetical protein